MTVITWEGMVRNQQVTSEIGRERDPTTRHVKEPDT